MLDTAGIVPHGRETSIGMVLIDSQFAATMNRKVTDSAIEFAIAPFRSLTEDEQVRLQEVADTYGLYGDRRATITVV